MVDTNWWRQTLRGICQVAILGGGLALQSGIKASASETDDSSDVSVEDLKNLSLEDLIDYEVTSVSRKSEKLSEAASAIQVITSEDIRRSGATTLPEALRLATNLQVAQINSHEWAITARGFNSSTANKLLVLIDGRTVYTPLYSGVFWDMQDVLLTDVDRIEVISGPGGTLWGANAVNGVINIITKRASETQGGVITGGGGTSPEGFGSVRYGGKLDDNLSYRAYYKYAEYGNTNLVNGDEAEDDWKRTQGGLRLDWEAADDMLTLQGDGYQGRAEQASGLDDVELDGGNVLGRWTHTFSDSSSLQLQGYYDYTHRVLPGTFSEQLHTYDLDLQHRLPIGERHDVIWGLGYRRYEDHVGNSALLQFLPADKITEVYSGFLQDEIMIFADRLYLTLGSKVEHNDYTGFEYQPSGKLALHLTPNHIVWAAISRAVRTPSRIDTDFYVPLLGNLQGGPSYESEKLIAYELGYRAQPTTNVSFSISLFYNDYHDLRSLEPGNPTVLDNGLEGESYGAEVNATYQLVEWWRLQAGYTYTQMELHTKSSSSDTTSESQEGDTPPHQAQLRSTMNVTDRLAWDFILRYVDNVANQDVPSYMELDMRLGFDVSKNVEIAIVGRNLLDDQHPEWGSSGSREIPRSIYGQLTVTF